MIDLLHSHFPTKKQPLKLHSHFPTKKQPYTKNMIRCRGLMTYSSLAENIFDLHLVEVFHNLSLVVVQRVVYFHTNKLNLDMKIWRHEF